MSTAVNGARRTFFAACSHAFRRLGVILGRRCDEIADWCEARAQ
jgi:hypothetical protein